MSCLQKFASVHANVHNHFNSERHLIDRLTFKQPCGVAVAVQLSSRTHSVRATNWCRLGSLICIRTFTREKCVNLTAPARDLR